MSGKMLALTCGLVCWIAVFIVAPTEAFEPESIVGAWLFDEGSGEEVMDATGNGNNGAFSGGGIEWVDGISGSALEFNASEEVVVPHADNLSLTSDFTLMAWINIPGPTTWQLVVGKDGPWPARNYTMFISDHTLGGAPAGLQGEPGSIHFALLASGGNAEYMINSPSVVADGEWHHIAVTYDKSMGKMYVDGELDGELEWDMDLLETTANVQIGRALTGVVDEVLIADQALSQDDIKLAMQGLEQMLSSTTAVSAADKLANTWGGIRREY